MTKLYASATLQRFGTLVEIDGSVYRLDRLVGTAGFFLYLAVAV
jgi:hypothetical protein